MTAEAEGNGLATAIADLHCHYPMHLPETATPPRHEVAFEEMQGFEDAFPQAPKPSLWKRIRQRAGWINRLRARLLTWAAHNINEPSHDDHQGDDGPPDWRVDLDRLRKGNVRFVFSVLYQPFAEIDLGRWPEGPPESGYITALTDQLTAVEAELAQLDEHGERHKIIRTAADLKSVKTGDQTAFFHCVEGGFHLGPTESEVRANVNALADAGVAYITLAHLFFRQVAKNTPALPFLSDRWYRLIFWQWGRRGLTKLGRAAVEEMYKRRVLIDISHMRADAVDEVFKMLKKLDKASGAGATDYPVIATHVGFQIGKRSYNLTADTVKRIAARGGVIGLIFSQHLMNEGVRCTDTETIDDSMQVLKSHIDAISKHAGGFCNIAIGSDLDGFIKPALSGLEYIDDLAKLVPRLQEMYPDHAQAILSGNALRVLDTIYAGR